MPRRQGDVPMNRLATFAAVLLSLPLLLAACVSTEEKVPVPTGAPPVTAVRQVDPEVEAWFRKREAASGMRLMAGDRIRIEVQGKPELTLTRDLPPNGEIPVLLMDKSVVPVVGLGRTPQELEGEVAKVHQKALVNPYV